MGQVVGWRARAVDRTHEGAGRRAGSSADPAVRAPGVCHAEAIRAKCERNLAIAQAEVEALAAQGSSADPSKVATTLVDLARSQAGAGQVQAAVDTCETVRELFPGTPQWLRATDLLAGTLAEAGMPDVALLLAQQMREAGADDGYCDWLSARALVKLGEPTVARQMLVGVSEFVNPGGHRVELTGARDAKDPAARSAPGRPLRARPGRVTGATRSAAENLS
jgi:hypothetical protein